MSKFLSLLAPFGLGGGGPDLTHYDDDFVDRLSHAYTTMLFVLFCLIVSTKQYVGDPIHCWVPGHFTSNYEEYTNKICWVSNTYFLPPDDVIPKETPQQMINYYQWVPMFMIFQGIFFYLPYLVWRGFNKKCGIDLDNVIEAGKSMYNSENKEKTLMYMMRQMDKYLGHFRSETNGCCISAKRYLATKCHLICGKKYGNYLVTLYLVTKALYLINAVGQLFILNAFLSADFHIYGITVMQGMWNKEDWPSARIFPRTTMCDFKVRAMGNTHRHTVQCVLSINFFNEKLYIIIWFWLVVLSIMTALSLMMWLLRIIFRMDQMRYIKRHLRYMGKIKRKEDEKLVTKFVRDYLRQDGVMVIRLMNANVNSIAVAEFLGEIWENFTTNPRVGHRSSIRLKSTHSDSEMDDV